MLKDILSTRLRELMEQRPDLDTQVKVSKRAGIGQSTVGRILSRDVHTSLDVVEAIAQALRVHPIALLTDPRDMTVTSAAAIGYEERELLRAWRLLSPGQQHAVMGYIEVAITPRQGIASESPKESGESSTVESTREVPRGAKAAVARAASRPPSATFETRLDDETAENKRERAGRR
jgi:transcriptional regulator with XRE-family HTH domain